MRNFLINTSLALAIGLTGLPLLAGQASAQDLELSIGRDGPTMRVQRSCDPRFEDCRYRDDHRSRQESYERDYDEDDYYERRARRGCNEDRALYKAERMGIRRARIVSVGRRTIEVRGRSRRGERVSIVFGRERGCPVYD